MTPIKFPQSDWRHDSVRATDGTDIRFDLKTQDTQTGDPKPLITTEASPVWVNVYDPAIRPDSKVRLVLSDQGLFAGPNGRDDRIVDLWVPESGHATVELSPLTIHDGGYGGNHDYRQQVALVVDGNWKQNPYGGDFLMDWYNHAH